MSDHFETPPKDAEEAYAKLLRTIQKHVEYPLSEDELHAAARNLIEFFKAAMEMHRQFVERENEKSNQLSQD